MSATARWIHDRSAVHEAAQVAPVLSATSELQLARAAAQGSQAAFNTLLRAHLRLVYAMASEFRVFGLPHEELVSEGLLGLVEGARRFDPERGVRLAAYSAWWIRAYMRRYTLSFRRIVRAPSSRNARKLLAKHTKLRNDLWQAQGERPDRDTLAEALGVPVRDLVELEGALYGRDVPCGAPQADANVMEPISEWPNPEAILAEADEQRSAHAAMEHALGQLSERERKILLLRNAGERPQTLTQLGTQLGISRERVRQLEKRGRQRLRSMLVASVA